MKITKEKKQSPGLGLTLKIIIGMILGFLVGILIKWITLPQEFERFLIDDIFKLGGSIFITVLKMLVVPVVLVSLICGSSSIDPRRLGRVGGKTVILYLLTTAIAITLAIVIASFFNIGSGIDVTTAKEFKPNGVLSLRQVILNLFPSNPFQALVQGNMLQIIVFALLFGVALRQVGDAGKNLIRFFNDMNHVIIRLVIMIMKVAPYGVFCLMAALFAEQGFKLIGELFGYFITVLFVLFVHLLITYPVFLRFLAQLNPLMFFRKMYTAMLFAFSVSSSSASIPVVLETVEKRLGVRNSIAAFVIPLGATINMDGTAIMQGVATVFIANAYHIQLGLVGYLTVIGMATLASIGTAGIPSVGLITLTMVLDQVGLPAEGIALIIGVDRLLDMTRTAVNVTGDAMVSCVVAKSEKKMDMDVYKDITAEIED